jgi:tRNA uridine 5-carbamoylmethylation protein Kti12
VDKLNNNKKFAVVTMNVPLDPKELNSVLSEFYSGQLGHARRAEIEQWLMNRFGSPNDNKRWQRALYLLINVPPEQSSQYIQWFGLYMLEEMIKNRTMWVVHMDPNDREQIKKSLFDILIKNCTLHSSVWTKICNVIVNIGKIEWPAQFPELLDHTLSLSMVCIFTFCLILF